MKKEGGHSMTEEVLFRHFAGQLDDARTRDVLNWMEQNDQNRLEYERVHIFYLDSKALANINKAGKKYDTQAAWQKIKAKNDIREEVDGKSNSSYLKLVASIVLAFMLGYLMYDYYFIEDQSVLAALEEPINQQLSDGSNITLNKGGELIYPEKFKGNKREVALVGEAYFEVEASKEKPFVIHVDDLQVMAVGTAFNVKAVRLSDSIYVSVDEGIVQMVFEGNSQQLEAGESGFFVKKSTTLQVSSIEKITTHNYWRTKRLNFYGNSLNDVVASIEKIYDVKVNLENEAIGNCKITVTFDDETVDHVLEIVSATLNLTVTQLDETYLLSGEGCE